jgi:hypothetical protein
MLAGKAAMATIVAKKNDHNCHHGNDSYVGDRQNGSNNNDGNDNNNGGSNKWEQPHI